jgi:fermentation-respiration switch protein FrsA (DUF1100 family)
MSRRLLLFTGGLLLLIFMLSMIFRRFTDSMLFYPVRGQWRTPADVGLSYEETWLDSGGDRLQAWWIPGEMSQPVILMFHGNAGAIADRLDNVLQMVRYLGVSILQVEYPGYGDSSGRPSERSLYAAGAASFAEARRRGEGRRLVVFGRSLGGAVAIRVARDHPVDGLIAESTFTSLPELAATTGIPLARQLVSYRFDSLDGISRVRVPLLLVHGNRDELVPYRMAERLLEAAVSSPRKLLHTVEGGTHNDTWAIGGTPYWQTWSDFLSSLGPTSQEAPRR